MKGHSNEKYYVLKLLFLVILLNLLPTACSQKKQSPPDTATIPVDTKLEKIRYTSPTPEQIENILRHAKERTLHNINKNNA